jgi:hypothetical protein
MWSDRLATEVGHRLLAKDCSAVRWWFDQTIETETLDFEIAAQTVRLILQRRSGPPANLAAAARPRQEGLAGATAGAKGPFHPGAADALEVLANDTSLATMVVFSMATLPPQIWASLPLDWMVGPDANTSPR